MNDLDPHSLILPPARNLAFAAAIDKAERNTLTAWRVAAFFNAVLPTCAALTVDGPMPARLIAFAVSLGTNHVCRLGIRHGASPLFSRIAPDWNQANIDSHRLLHEALGYRFSLPLQLIKPSDKAARKWQLKHRMLTELTKLQDQTDAPQKDQTRHALRRYPARTVSAYAALVATAFGIGYGQYKAGQYAGRTTTAICAAQPTPPHNPALRFLHRTVC